MNRWVSANRIAFVACALVGACEGPPNAGSVNAAITSEPGACARPSDPTLVREVARHCAEDFVLRQGYTSAPALVDSTSIVYEFVEPATNWREALKWRHNALQPSAVAVCDLHPNWY